MQASLKKFVGHSVIQATEQAVKEEPVYMTKADLEQCLYTLHKNKRGGGGGRSRTRSKSLPETTSTYKGKKNPLGPDFKPLKCFKCKCDHEEKCSCPCVYHLANKCPGKDKKQEQRKMSDLSLFMQVNSAGLQVDQALFMMDQTTGLYPASAPTDPVFPASAPDGGRKEELVLLTEKLEKLCLITGEEENKALIDCACPNTVAGSAWLKFFISQLTENQRQKMMVTQSQRVYKFGGGEIRPSKCLVRLPCNVAGKNILLSTEVVDAEIPLLLGNSSLEKAKAVLHIAPCKVELLGAVIPMEKTESGHYSIQVKVPMKEDKETEMCLVVQQEILTDAKLEKLHHYWGHTTADKLAKLIQNAGKLCPETKLKLEKIKSDCTGCQLYKNRIPAPAVAIPRATRVNQLLTVDLKEWDTGKHRYIVYFVDMFSRFLLAVFVPNKQAETIGEAMLEKWVSVFGPPGTMHSDRGGEFLNEDLSLLCEYLNTKQTATAAYSPNQNGCNEANHAVVDRMLQKMLMTDPSLKPEVALCWAVNAKNSLTNYQGFSPSQIVFGENPRLPALYSAGPPGHEEVVMSKSMADHINAMHLGREAFVECEADRVLRTALRKRVYARNENIGPGDWIYYKNKTKRWEGPVKVTTCSGKLLYAVRAGRLLTINTDHAVLVKSGEEIIDKSNLASETSQRVKSSGIPTSTPASGLSSSGLSNPYPASSPASEAVYYDPPGQHPVFAPADGSSASTPAGGFPTSAPAGGSPASAPAGGFPTSAPNGGSPTSAPDGGSPASALALESFHSDPTGENIPIDDANEDLNDGSKETETDNSRISYDQIKRHNLIRFKQREDTEWTRGLVGIRAGK